MKEALLPRVLARPEDEPHRQDEPEPGVGTDHHPPLLYPPCDAQQESQQIANQSVPYWSGRRRRRRRPRLLLLLLLLLVLLLLLLLLLLSIRLVAATSLCKFAAYNFSWI